MPEASAEVVRAREQERRRLACDLHDECGQHLTALRLHLDVLRSAAAGADRVDQIDRAIGLAVALDRSLDAVAHGLRPPPLEAGAGQAVAAFARRWSLRAGVCVEVYGADLWDGVIPDETAVHLYRTAQEALHNIAKHAAATRVVLRLARSASEVSLTVVDDGVGFTREAALARRRAGGFGLASLQERAAAMNGRLEIVSAAGRGTTLTMCVALPAAAAAPATAPVRPSRGPAYLPAPA